MLPLSPPQPLPITNNCTIFHAHDTHAQIPRTCSFFDRFCFAFSGAAQSAYRVVLRASDGLGMSAAANETLWDTGKVVSNRSQNVVYAGAKPLVADTMYSWTVWWWDNDNLQSDPASAHFSTGLLGDGDWSGAQWIGGRVGLYRRQFNTTGSVHRATAYVVGLGYFKLNVNGQRLSKHELGAFTTFSERCYYDSIDVTAAFSTSSHTHAIGVSLGPGWYALNRCDSAGRD